jgi:hypothetical protein
MGFELITGFIEHLQHGIPSNCNAAQITVTHTSLLSLLQPPLVVGWLQFSNKGFLAACELHSLTTDSTFHCCAHGLLAKAQGLSACRPTHNLRPPNSLKAPIGSPYIASGQTPQKTLLLAITLLMCVTCSIVVSLSTWRHTA